MSKHGCWRCGLIAPMDASHVCLAPEAWWRVIPKRSAADVYRRQFETRDDAERFLAAIRRRDTYRVVAYNRHGKVLLDV